MPSTTTRTTSSSASSTSWIDWFPLHGFPRSAFLLTFVCVLSTCACYSLTLTRAYFTHSASPNAGYADVALAAFKSGAWAFRAILAQQTFSLVFNVGLFNAVPPCISKATTSVAADSTINLDAIASHESLPRAPSVGGRDGGSGLVAEVNRWIKKRGKPSRFGIVWLLSAFALILARLFHSVVVISAASNGFTARTVHDYDSSVPRPLIVNQWWELVSFVAICMLSPFAFKMRVDAQRVSNSQRPIRSVVFYFIFLAFGAWASVLLRYEHGGILLVAFTSLAILSHYVQTYLVSRRGQLYLVRQNFDHVYFFFAAYYAFRALDEISFTITKWLGSGSTMGVLGTTLARGILGGSVLLLEYLSKSIFGTCDMWLVFGHRLLEDLTVTSLSLDGVASSDTFLMYSMSNFVIIAMRDCGIVNDVIFGLANKVSVGALYAAELPFDDKLALAAFSDPIPPKTASSSSPTSPKGTETHVPQPIAATAITSPTMHAPPSPSAAAFPCPATSPPPKLELPPLSPLALHHSQPSSPSNEIPSSHPAPAVPLVQEPLLLAPLTSVPAINPRSYRARSGSALKNELVVAESTPSDLELSSLEQDAAGHGKPGSFASDSPQVITAAAGGHSTSSLTAADAARQGDRSGAVHDGGRLAVPDHRQQLGAASGGELLASVASTSMPSLSTSMSFSTTASSQTDTKPMLSESPSSPSSNHGAKPAPSPISAIRNLPRIGSVPLHTMSPTRDPSQSSALSLLPSATLLRQQQQQQQQQLRPRQVSSPTSPTPGVTPSSAPLPPLLALWTEELREQVARTEHSLVARIATMVSMFAAFALEAHFHVERSNWNYRLALLAGLTASAAIAQIAVLWILGSKVHRVNELLLRLWKKREKKFDEWRIKRGGRPVSAGGGGGMATPTASMTGAGQTTSVRSIKWTDSESVQSTASLPDPQASTASLSTAASTAALEPNAASESSGTTQQQGAKKKSKPPNSKEKEAEKREQRRRRESRRRFERLHLVRFWNSDFSVATSPTLIVMLVLFATVSRFQPDERA